LLMAHLDVVPADAADGWEKPPFDGTIANGFVWGRGAMDDKASVLGILEAVESLLSENYRPNRSIYIAFGQDEEIGGKNGAARIATLLKDRNVQFEYVLDEGLFVADGIVPGVSKPVALIGVAEKGFMSVQLTVESEGGHSSVPPPHTSIGILSAAINKLEENPMPARLGDPVTQMFDYLGPEMSWDKRLLFSNMWLFRPLIQNELSKSATTNASIRTTTAVTVVEGGKKDNVLPAKAMAVVNFRILPGDSIQGVMAHVKSTINDNRVQIVPYGTDISEPSRISSINAFGFQVIQKTVGQIFRDTLVAPALLVGGTDSRHYEVVCDQIYRFVPQTYRSEDVDRLHGRNERIAIENYVQSIKFYYQLIKNSSGGN
jgi:carboxypeptidase PM20D1